MLFDQKHPVHTIPGPGQGDNKKTNIATYRLNQPRGRFSENILLPKEMTLAEKQKISNIYSI